MHKKFRIVFDASCKTDRGLSLNETQLVGEKLQDNVFELIMRFRTHRIGITADIQKRYLQIGIHPHQWDLQRVIWRPHPLAELKEYWLTVVIFGMASAPHCAVRAMQQCAEDENEQFPRAAQIVKRDFYMDDCLTGADDKTEAKNLCQELTKMLQRGCFTLDKWHSNEPEVLPVMPTAYQPMEAVELSEPTDTTVLGLRWLPSSDELAFKFHPLIPVDGERETMRQVLSQIARLFDPNGYLGPAIILAKIIMQRIWESGVSWDELIPSDIAHDWAQWQKQLPALTKIKIPRWLGISPSVGFSLHGFSDASEKAFGAVVYVRVENTNGVRCTLIASRSRVAPLKKVTIPRLELCAAKLLGELLQTIKQACGFTYIKSTLWTDSAIVLQWMRKDAAALKPFVHNRVQSILSTTDSDWRHVPTETNPADLLSRGVAPKELEATGTWWQGPDWLQQNSGDWPHSQPELSLYVQREIRAEMKANWLDHADDQHLRPIQKAHINVITLEMRGEGRFKENIADMALWTSTLRRLVRRTAYIRRFFLNYCRTKQEWRLEPLTEVEEEEALWCLIRREQKKCYVPELKALRDPDENLPAKSQVLPFNPFIDANGILRVGGRLEAANMPYEQMHPVLLPEVSHLAQLLIRNAHQETLHGGCQLMSAHLRQRFWITGLRRAIHTNNQRCVICARNKRKLAEQLMGSLPADRVQQSYPFQHSGVDFAGPFETKPRPGRCKLRDKKWVAVFVCMATKAVHLELVDGLSTQDFIKAFLRFTSLRGKCTHLWSDHGTNFVGADTELERMAKSWADADTDAYRELRENMKINWHFITPSAPHQGGVWGSAVKSMKFHLHRLVGGQTLLDSDMRTILAQISAGQAINSTFR